MEAIPVTAAAATPAYIKGNGCRRSACRSPSRRRIAHSVALPSASPSPPSTANSSSTSAPAAGVCLLRVIVVSSYTHTCDVMRAGRERSWPPVLAQLLSLCTYIWFTCTHIAFKPRQKEPLKSSIHEEKVGPTQEARDQTLGGHPSLPKAPPISANRHSHTSVHGQLSQLVPTLGPRVPVRTEVGKEDRRRSPCPRTPKH